MRVSVLLLIKIALFISFTFFFAHGCKPPVKDSQTYSVVCYHMVTNEMVFQKDNVKRVTVDDGTTYIWDVNWNKNIVTGAICVAKIYYTN